MCRWTKKAAGQNILRFGTLNVRGIRTNTQQTQLADDMVKYKLHMLAIQETHIGDDGAINITSSDGKHSYDLFHVGEANNSHHGVGIVTDKSLVSQFSKISDRSCKATVKMNVGNNKTRDLVFISTYAPTLVKSEQNSEIRDKYYTDLNTEMNTNVSNRSLLIVGGDFNAKTGSAWKDHPENMGAFGKGEVNSNGEALLEMAKNQELILSNTLFYHKMAHRTTWTCPQRINDHKDKHGQIRRNPYRNQIDYILVRTKHKQMIQNSRSYSGINTNTDHRIVITTIKLEWFKIYNSKQEFERYDTHKLSGEASCKEAYQTTITEKYELANDDANISAQQQWDSITSACLNSAKEHLKCSKKNRASENPRIQLLSKEQQKLRHDINATTDKTKCREKKTKRNKILKEIHQLVEKEKTKKIMEQVEEIESNKNDSNRMYQAVRQLQQTKPKKRLMVDGEKGLTTNVTEQVEIITNHFKSVFHIDTEKEIPEIHPQEMETPFTAGEVEKAVNSLKNNKSPGCDNIKAELIKHSPPVIHQGIANLLNHMAKSGEYPREVKTGILIPHKFNNPQKPSIISCEALVLDCL